MANAMIHRGPDDEGIWLDGESGVLLVHRRLAILELSDAGHQPMQSRSGRFVCVFNGEIYNHLELRKSLRECSGHVPASPESQLWRGGSDTETLLAAVEEWGFAETLKRTTGMFAIAIWDRKERVLKLARDRLGEKPLYYGWAGKSFVFASQPSALKAHPDWNAEIDRDALSLFFRYGYIPTPYSIYRGIWKLSPGSWLSMSLDDLRAYKVPEPVAFWSLQHVAAQSQCEPFEGSDDDALGELERLASESVRMQLVADVPIGAFLSGGVDSSAVVALMQSQSTRRVRTFTIGFNDAEFDEAEYARAVANHLGTRHSELYVDEAVAREVIPRLPCIFDEPFSDSSQIPAFLVSQMARREVTVSLSGDAGDELFGGYNRYVFGRRLARWRDALPRQARRVAAWTMRSIPSRVVDYGARQIGTFAPGARIANVSEKLRKVADGLDASGESEIFRRLVSHWDGESLVIRGRPPVSSMDQWMGLRHTANSTEQWMMNADIATYLMDDILVKVDRAAMASSLETRVPFLNHRLVEFALRLPLNMKLRNGEGKWLLRKLLFKHVPQELIDRPKMGFSVPIGSWLRGPLRPWAEALLDQRRLDTEGFLNPSLVHRKWRDHVSGRANWQHDLWDVLMFQQWLESSFRSR